MTDGVEMMGNEWEERKCRGMRKWMGRRGFIDSCGYTDAQ